MDSAAKPSVSIPDFLSIETMLKARPSEEEGERYIYLEASKEGVDQQNEVVLSKALAESAHHFLRYGSLDIDHKSMPTIASRYGINDPENWEIGVPVEVKADERSVFVKGRLFSGDTPLAARAGMVWDSLTKLSPPARWYPSVGGAPLARKTDFDPVTKASVGYVTKVRWTNLALSRQPVNQHVAPATVLPFGTLTKCWTAEGFDLRKSLQAGYGSDVSALSGGGALRVQSLEGKPKSYFKFRDRLSDAITSGIVKRQDCRGLNASSRGPLGLSSMEAGEWVMRFLNDLKRSLTERSSE